MAGDYEAYRELCAQVHHHNARYFRDSDPEIDDATYDRLLKSVRELEGAHPEWIHPGSPTQRVGEGVTRGFEQVPHRSSMLSFDKVFTAEELEVFDRRLQKALTGPIRYSVEAKLDGCAISLWYRNGYLERGLTRGNGVEGDDVTRNLLTIAELPQRLSGDPPSFVEVRGEIFLTRSQFARINEERRQRSLSPYANARNLTSGTLKTLDSALVASRGLSVRFYAVTEDSSRSITTFAAGRAAMKNWGLPVLESANTATGIQRCWSAIDALRHERATLDFEIDGAVVKVDDLAAGEDLGYTGQYYRWGIAYKFTAERALTTIDGIVLQVGRSGVITPVAILRPVRLAGTTVTRATLHNAEEIRRKDIRLGDQAFVEKGGDIIPKVVGIDLAQRPDDSAPWVPPERCPTCGAVLVREQVHLRCKNSHCADQVLGRLRHFVSKAGMNIEGLGGKVLELLIERLQVQTPADLYRLEVADLDHLPGLGSRSATALVSAIAASRDRPFGQFLMALGIPHIGKSAAEAIAWKLGALESLLTCESVQLLQIEGIGEKGALSLLTYLRDPNTNAQLQQLRDVGVAPKSPQRDRSFAEHPFRGKRFVLTGTLDGYSRPEATELIEVRGGLVVPSLSKKVDFLIVGRNPGSKLTKANEWSLSQLNEEQFARLL